jgi:GNAT superfamily N-acetyltransferase
MNSGLDFRPATESDIEFLTSLRRETMWAHLKKSGIPVAELEQRARVLYRFDCAQIVSLAGHDIGLLKVCRDCEPWELSQIQLVPARQRKGLGRILIEGVLTEAKTAGVAVRLHVPRASPARRLYARLGFVVTGEDALGYLMRCDAQQAQDGDRAE